MRAFFPGISRCFLAALWLFGALQRSGKLTKLRAAVLQPNSKNARYKNCGFTVFSDGISESKIFCQAEPEDPKIVVLGVNSGTVSLKWESCRGDASETLNSFIFRRQKPGDITPQQIASRRNNDGGFTMSDPFKDFKKYRAFREQELRIFNVQRNEEYVYTLSINFQKSDGEGELLDLQFPKSYCMLIFNIINEHTNFSYLKNPVFGAGIL